MMIDHRLLLQNISEAVFMLDKDGYISFSNKAASAITGFEERELLQRPISFLHENRNDKIRQDYELDFALKHGRFHTECWYKKKDDTRLWADVTFMPVFSEEGHTGFTCVLRDGWPKKQEELALYESEQRHRLMVQGVRDYAIFALDTEGNIITWNDGAQKIKGYAPGEIIGKHFSIFYTAEDLMNKKTEMELRVAKEVGKYEEEGWRVRKNGSVFWANVVITGLYNENNKLIGFSKVTRDLTERRENDERLRQSEERFRSLIEQVSDYGIFMMDNMGRIISWNEGAKRINGYTADEIIGKYFSIFYPEEEVLNGKPARELRIARAEGKYEEEGWRLRKDGTRFWASIVITAVYSNDGALIGFSKVTRDLTERKEAEQVIRESHESFRRLAGELKVTNDELSYINKELEQFTSIVSHDLQEPIRTIKSFLQLIDIKLDEGQRDELKKYINKSISAANRMKELILNLLHYSQLGKSEASRDTISVDALIGEALQNLKSAVDSSNADIVVESEIQEVQGDRIQLVQLIQNLLSNALKFTDATRPKVVIRAKKQNGHVQFSVTDNGIGMAPADLHKSFEIFRRLHTKKDYPGTGIGLAICKKIVDQHSGRIWPESAPGKGTTFYFTLYEADKQTN